MPDETRATEEEQEAGPERIEQEEDMRGPTPGEAPQDPDPWGDDDDE